VVFASRLILTDPLSLTVVFDFGLILTDSHSLAVVFAFGLILRILLRVIQFCFGPNYSLSIGIVQVRGLSGPKYG
jgi:hypothetical protein